MQEEFRSGASIWSPTNQSAWSFLPPAGAQPGAVLPLLQPVEVVNADGTIELAWFLADTGVVGEDGMIRTTSPPNLGLGMRKHSASLDINLRPSAFAAMFATGAGGSLLGTMAIIMDQSQRSQVINSPGIIIECSHTHVNIPINI